MTPPHSRLRHASRHNGKPLPVPGGSLRRLAKVVAQVITIALDNSRSLRSLRSGSGLARFPIWTVQSRIASILVAGRRSGKLRGQCPRAHRALMHYGCFGRCMPPIRIGSPVTLFWKNWVQSDGGRTWPVWSLARKGLAGRNSHMALAQRPGHPTHAEIGRQYNFFVPSSSFAVSPLTCVLPLRSWPSSVSRRVHRTTSRRHSSRCTQSRTSLLTARPTRTPHVQATYHAVGHPAGRSSFAASQISLACIANRESPACFLAG